MSSNMTKYKKKAKPIPGSKGLKSWMTFGKQISACQKIYLTYIKIYNMFHEARARIFLSNGVVHEHSGYSRRFSFPWRVGKCIAKN